MSHLHDCLVVGGGAAGLNAALVLGRARRDVLLVDAGRQSNRPAHLIGGLLAQDGTSPAGLYVAAHAQLDRLPSITRRSGEVLVLERRDAERFRAVLADGSEVTARRVLLAAGMDYAAPDLPGIAERWGDTVFHCPFCHGWEVRDAALGVLGDGGAGLLKALLLRGWSDDVVLLGRDLDDAGRAKLAAAGIRVDERRVAAVRAPGATVVFGDGDELRRDALLVAAPLQQRSALAADLGVELGPPGTVVVDEFARTSVEGVFAAGDVAGTTPMVASAMGAGAAAGAFIHQHLLAGEHGLAFPLAPTQALAAPAAAGP